MSTALLAGDAVIEMSRVCRLRYRKELKGSYGANSTHTRDGSIAPKAAISETEIESPGLSLMYGPAALRKTSARTP